MMTEASGTIFPMALSWIHAALNIALAIAGSKLLLDRMQAPSLPPSNAAKLSAWFILLIGQVHLIGVLLGYLGLLTPWSFTLVQLLFTGCLFALRDKSRLTEWTPREDKSQSRLDDYAALFLFGLAVILLITGLFLSPADFDSVGYRLGRIGQWLQNGDIYQAPTTDPRMNYLGVNGDMLMLWLTSPFPSGYPLTNLPQWAGGVALALACWALMEAMGFSRTTRLCMLALYASMPVVIGQMMTPQVDLLFAGIMISGLLWLYLSLRSGASPWIAWVAIAMAIGTKGTAFYMGPGLLALGLIWLWKFKPSQKTVIGNTVAASVCLLAFAAPRHIENYINFGNPLAPEKEIVRLHGTNHNGFAWDKLWVNGVSYNLELLSPYSNPPLVADFSEIALDALGRGLLPESDPYALGKDRRGYYLSHVGGIGSFENSLQGSCGLVPVLLALLGAILFAFRRHRSRLSNDSSWILIGLTLAFASLAILLSGFYNWSPYKFRYFLPGVPVILLLAGVAIQQLNPRKQKIALISLSFFALVSFGKQYTNGTTTGWRGLTKSDPTIVTKTMEKQGQMLSEEVEAGSKLAICLSYYSPLSPFFRNGLSLQTVIIPENDLSGMDSPADFFEATNYDYLITHPSTFAEHDSSIFTRASLHLPEYPKFNFVLYRKQDAGEATNGYIKRIEQAPNPNALSTALVIHLQRSGAEPIQFAFRNLDRAPLSIQLRASPSGETQSLIVSPQQQVSIEFTQPSTQQIAVLVQKTTGATNENRSAPPRYQFSLPNLTLPLGHDDPWINSPNVAGD
ncbi:MAG: hypothetical protein AAFX93_17740 [Verrucomicrobiota bacterium]